MSDIHLIPITFASLFPITNPFGNAAIFLSLTKGEDVQTRAATARKASIYMFCILTGFLLGGHYILDFFGLSIDGIRIAGGVLISIYGFRQLNPEPKHTHSEEEHAEAKKKEDISFSPLAMPLLAGPGAIAAVMGLLSKMNRKSPVDYIYVGIGIALTCGVCWLILKESNRLMRFLGVNGANALTKLMGFILLCIGVQLLIEGITSVLQ